ncbi:Transcriptional regulator WAR1 [Candida tropicalis]
MSLVKDSTPVQHSSSLNDTSASLLKRSTSTKLKKSESESEVSNKKPKVTRRSVACKSCHSLKVKCSPSDPKNPASPCIRCVNAGRRCDIDLNQTRKRRKKAEILEARRLAELQQHHESEEDDHDGSYEQEQPQQPLPTLAIAPMAGFLSAPDSTSSSAMQSAIQSSVQSTIQSPSRFDLIPSSISRSQAGSTIPPVPSNLNPNSSSSQSPPLIQQQVKQQSPASQLSSPHNGNYVGEESASPGSKDSEIIQLKQRIKFLESQLATKSQVNKLRNVETTSDGQSPPFVSKFDLESEINTLAESSAKLTDLTNQLNESASRRIQLVSAKEPVDLISKGIISAEEAQERLILYREKIYVQHPVIEIPDNISALDLSRSQPFLFNSIMSATNLRSQYSSIDTALAIDNEAIKSIAVEVMVVGTKSVELVKSFLVLCLYYNSPELFRQRRYHMLNTICVSLLHDLGIFARPIYSFNQSEGTVRQETPTAEKMNDEYRSLVLITYFSTVSICIVLRRSIYVKWTPYVEECCSILENSSEEKYNRIALFARMNYMLEKIHNLIHSSDVSERTSNAARYVIQELQKSLLEVKQNIRPNQYALMSYYYSIEAYLHEPILSEVFSNENELDTKAVKSLCICTASCLNALDEYSKLTPEDISLMPFSFGSRVMYTIGMLLRLRYLILSLPSHIDKELVPKRAVTTIQNVSRLVERANILNPTNHYLTKMRLVLQLFIQTYATQVLDLLRKNGSTPQNFKPNDSEVRQLRALAKEYNDVRENRNSLVSDTRESEPLDVLSYAASFRRDNNNDNNNNNRSNGIYNGSPGLQKCASEEESRRKSVHYPNFGSVGNSPNTPASTPAPNSFLNGQSLQQIPQVPVPPQLQSRPSAQFHQFGDVVQPTNFQNPEFRSLRLPSISNSLNVNNLANPDQLENSYHVLNDEFWSNLLSNDSTTDKINFTSNNFNGNSINDDVFFMN